MKRFLLGVLTTLVIGMVVGVVAVYSGLLNVSADTPHSQLAYRMIETARERSIDRQIRDLTVPANLDDAERIRRGAGNYAAMCVECHLAPGKTDSEIRMGLYPKPPNLTQPDETTAAMAARHFWVIKHGIKASAMPAWSKGGIEDEAIWDIVAFLRRMPALSPSQYVALVESSEGHSHGGAGHSHGGHTGDQAMHANDEHIHSEGNTGGHEHSGNHEH
jgi:mono/diheme cytochrome c family protein